MKGVPKTRQETEVDSQETVIDSEMQQPTEKNHWIQSEKIAQPVIK